MTKDERRKGNDDKPCLWRMMIIDECYVMILDGGCDDDDLDVDINGDDVNGGDDNVDGNDNINIDGVGNNDNVKNMVDADDNVDVDDDNNIDGYDGGC